MERDVEGQTRIFPAEQPRYDHQMGRAGDRKKFGEALDYPKDKGVKLLNHIKRCYINQ